MSKPAPTHSSTSSHTTSSLPPQEPTYTQPQQQIQAPSSSTPLTNTEATSQGNLHPPSAPQTLQPPTQQTTSAPTQQTASTPTPASSQTSSQKSPPTLTRKPSFANTPNLPAPKNADPKQIWRPSVNEYGKPNYINRDDYYPPGRPKLWTGPDKNKLRGKYYSDADWPQAQQNEATKNAQRGAASTNPDENAVKSDQEKMQDWKTTMLDPSHRQYPGSNPISRLWHSAGNALSGSSQPASTTEPPSLSLSAPDSTEPTTLKPPEKEAVSEGDQNDDESDNGGNDQNDQDNNDTYDDNSYSDHEYDDHDQGNEYGAGNDDDYDEDDSNQYQQNGDENDYDESHEEDYSYDDEDYNEDYHNHNGNHQQHQAGEDHNEHSQHSSSHNDQDEPYSY